jgi:hypothetical protein
VVKHGQTSLFLLIFSFATYVRDAGVAGPGIGTDWSLRGSHAANRGIARLTNRKNRVLRVRDLNLSRDAATHYASRNPNDAYPPLDQVARLAGLIVSRSVNARKGR